MDGFRLDAARHFPRWMLTSSISRCSLAKTTPLLDGSQDHPFFSARRATILPQRCRPTSRRTSTPTTWGRLAATAMRLDFNLFGALVNNLTANGLQNDWRNIRSASIDSNDDGFGDNGSQGVAFARSHDELGAYLGNVAHAYMLMRPGNAIVYMNAKEFGDQRDFPRGGRDDALGGFYGDAITTLVDIRNTHGRGNFLPTHTAGRRKRTDDLRARKVGVVG